MADDRYREIIVKLTPRSTQALGALAARHGLSEIDVVNRALQIYFDLDSRKAAGEMILAHEPGGDTHVLEWS